LQKDGGQTLMFFSLLQCMKNVKCDYHFIKLFKLTINYKKKTRNDWKNELMNLFWVLEIWPDQDWSPMQLETRIQGCFRHQNKIPDRSSAIMPTFEILNFRSKVILAYELKCSNSFFACLIWNLLPKVIFVPHLEPFP
jgi:hypothetical protein